MRAESLSQSELEKGFSRLPKRERERAKQLVTNMKRLRERIGRTMTSVEMMNFKRLHMQQALRNSKLDLDEVFV